MPKYPNQTQEMRRRDHVVETEAAVPMRRKGGPGSAPVDHAEILPTTDPRTMSSREIAEICGKRHDNVIRDIEKMLADIFGDSSDLRDHGVTETYDTRGYVSEIHLPKDLTITLITGYRADLRYKVVKRLEDLEAARRPQPVAAAIPDLSNPRSC